MPVREALVVLLLIFDARYISGKDTGNIARITTTLSNFTANVPEDSKNPLDTYWVF
jgi:hypothetical protein